MAASSFVTVTDVGGSQSLSHRDANSWQLVGRPSSTASAIVALVMAEQHSSSLDLGTAAADYSACDAAYQGDLCELLVESLKSLAHAQNLDGGWGPTHDAESTIDETLSVLAALKLAGMPACNGDIGQRLDEFIARQGGIRTLTDCEEHDSAETLAVAFQLAVVDRVDWGHLPQFAFDPYVRKPHDFGLTQQERALRIACGVASHYFAPSRNPWRRRHRQSALPSAISCLGSLQASDGSFGGVVRTTAQLVALLSAARHAESEVVRKGVEFLLSAVDVGSTWPDFYPTGPRQAPK